ncbi:jg20412 [Pararge aegeria aegeria]|uniref:Jg20412 protein n=1 Tax=Pararge aegeria aegeria TaxID=348720 RepID=A0A8S4R7D3_9NEOP|nr:jg20412 [Pararge aegeria aegeria]
MSSGNRLGGMTTILPTILDCVIAYHQIDIPIFFYASETWTLSETEKKRKDALEMWRRMLGVTWNMFRTNKSILDELSIKQRLSSAVQARILSSFGHVFRRKDVSIEGTRARGRSPMRWTDHEGHNRGSST